MRSIGLVETNRHTLDRWGKKRGEKVTMHMLRHTYATLALHAGVDVVTVSGQLGHSRKSTTLDFYASAVQGSGRVAADAVAKALSR
jgi:integrase